MQSITDFEKGHIINSRHLAVPLVILKRPLEKIISTIADPTIRRALKDPGKYEKVVFYDHDSVSLHPRSPMYILLDKVKNSKWLKGGIISFSNDFKDCYGTLCSTIKNARAEILHTPSSPTRISPSAFSPSILDYFSMNPILFSKGYWQSVRTLFNKWKIIEGISDTRSEYPYKLEDKTKNRYDNIWPCIPSS
jgi:hypothetical protein